MKEAQHLADDFIQIHHVPLVVAFAHEPMDSANDVARPPRVGKNIVQQLLEHLQIRRTAREKSLSGSGVTGNGGERLVQLCASDAVSSPINATRLRRAISCVAGAVQVRPDLRRHVDGYAHELG